MIWIGRDIKEHLMEEEEEGHSNLHVSKKNGTYC